MQRPEDSTYSVPRFLSFIELGYLLDAAKTADEHLAAKLPTGDTQDDRDTIGNLNATRQSLLRAIFISSFGVVEQNLDELVLMWGKKQNSALVPSDLQGHGIQRSLNFAKKVLGRPLDLSARHWKDLLVIQALRNHLIHYGPDFDDSVEHDKRFDKFSKTSYVTLRPIICFTIPQIESLFELYMECLGDLSQS